MGIRMIDKMHITFAGSGGRALLEHGVEGKLRLLGENPPSL